MPNVCYQLLSKRLKIYKLLLSRPGAKNWAELAHRIWQQIGDRNQAGSTNMTWHQTVGRNWARHLRIYNLTSDLIRFLPPNCYSDSMSSADRKPNATDANLLTTSK